jgi:hypothetical protein
VGLPEVASNIPEQVPGTDTRYKILKRSKSLSQRYLSVTGRCEFTTK